MSLQQREEKNIQGVAGHSQQTSATPFQHHTAGGGVPGWSTRGSPPGKETWRGAPISRQRPAKSRAHQKPSSPAHQKHPSQTPPLKAPLPNCPPPRWRRAKGKSPERAQRQLFTATVPQSSKASRCKDLIHHLPLKSQLGNQKKKKKKEKILFKKKKGVVLQGGERVISSKTTIFWQLLMPCLCGFLRI